LIVGGHLAGQWRSHDLPTFTVGHIEIEPDGRPTDDLRYLHGVGVCETDIHVQSWPLAEFWVPEGKDAPWAMSELAREYISNCAQKNSQTGRMDG
jgi:hypothetical protein